MKSLHRPSYEQADDNVVIIQTHLLAWFDKHARKLPWRSTRNPYHILVSEMMLQQTQVDRVLPKYQAFLERFPTLEALADAPTSEVIRAWAGLGYNRRAVNMQRTARMVLEQHSDHFPREPDALRALPGIGPYTAGALACFAFEQDVAFMDTNIRRVVQRLFVGPAPDPPPTEADLLAVAQAVIPPGKGWAWNQAIMELGALICTAAAPACWRCPVQEHCRDYAARRTADEHTFSTEALPAQRVRRVAERRETAYVGSSRFYRGRIVGALRELPPGEFLPLQQLGQQVKADFGDADIPWLRGLAEGLARDGLLLLEGEAARLPD